MNNFFSGKFSLNRLMQYKCATQQCTIEKLRPVTKKITGCKDKPVRQSKSFAFLDEAIFLYSGSLAV